MSVKINLNNGSLIPAIGLGGWSGTTPEERAKATAWMLTALKAGYRHIDTAYSYGTEKYVGEAIRQSGIPREDIWVTTKLPWHHAGKVSQSIKESLERAGFDYYDLYLMHWPQVVVFEDDDEDKPILNPDGSWKTRNVPFNEIWADMEKVLETGAVKAIGVSNFSIKNLEKLLETAKVIPAVNQVELHPYLAQNDLVDYCKSKGIIVEAYTPTGYATVRGDPVIVELAEKYKVAPAQIILAWHAARGTVVVPKSADEERQKQNLNPPTLLPEDKKRIDTLDRNQRLCNKANPVNGTVYGWNYEQLGW